MLLLEPKNISCIARAASTKNSLLFCNAEREFAMRARHQEAQALRKSVMLVHASQTSRVIQNAHDKHLLSSRPRHICTVYKARIPIWTYRAQVLGPLMQQKLVWLSAAELFVIGCMTPVTKDAGLECGFTDIEEAFDILFCLVQQWHDKDAVYQKGVTMALELEAERKRKEMEELQQFSGASPKASNEEANRKEKFVPLELRDNLEVVERALMAQFAVADSERKGMMRQDEVAALLLGD